MKRFIKRILVILAAIILSAIAWFAYQLNNRPSLAPYPNLMLAPVDGKAASGRVTFLGIGVLGKQDESFHQAYWRETVRSIGARRVIPIHWDDFTLPLDQPLVPLPRPFDDFDVSMRFVLERGRQDGVDVRFAPAWARIDPFAGM